MQATLMLIVSIVAAASALHAQDAPTTHPGIIDVTDKSAIERAMNRDVIVEGVVERAAWSRTGRVMNIEFRGAENGLLAVVFVNKRAELDAAFGGDLGKALEGARVRLRGTIKPYGGRVESMKGRPQIIIEHGNQLTIVERAPATQPQSSGRTED